LSHNHNQFSLVKLKNQKFCLKCKGVYWDLDCVFFCLYVTDYLLQSNVKHRHQARIAKVNTD